MIAREKLYFSKDMIKLRFWFLWFVTVRIGWRSMKMWAILLLLLGIVIEANQCQYPVYLTWAGVWQKYNWLCPLPLQGCKLTKESQPISHLQVHGEYLPKGRVSFTKPNNAKNCSVSRTDFHKIFQLLMWHIACYRDNFFSPTIITTGSYSHNYLARAWIITDTCWHGTSYG